MSIKDSHNRRVTFDTREELGDKIDKLVVTIGKLATRDSRSDRQFKPQVYQGKGRGLNRGNMTDTIMTSKVIRIDIDQIVEIGDSIGKTDRPRYIQNYRRGNFRGNTRMHQTFERQNRRGEYRNNYRNDSHGRNRDRNRFRERSFSKDFSSNRNNMSMSNSRSRSGSRASTNRDRIRSGKCREYDHFTKDCPTSREERELEQLQQMLN